MGMNQLMILGARGAAFLPLTSLGCAVAEDEILCALGQRFPSSRLWTGSSRHDRKETATIQNNKSISTLCRAAAIGDHAIVNSTDLDKVICLTRQRFCEEVALSVRDEDISTAKVALLIAAEDEAFLSINSEKDIAAAQHEGREPFVPTPPKAAIVGNGGVLGLPLSGISILEWLDKLDRLSKQAEAHLGSHYHGHSPIEVLKAVNTVMFQVHGFTRTMLSQNSKSSYLHLVMTYGSGTAVMLSILFMEVCQRLGLKMQGAAMGENFWIWPSKDGMKIGFEPWEGCTSLLLADDAGISGPSSSTQWDGGKNMECGNKLEQDCEATAKPVSNRDIVEIVLQNLKLLYWKQASRAYEGLPLASPLKPVLSLQNMPTNKICPTSFLPRDLRLALAASERLLILRPENWMLRKDHGLLLYHSRRYGEAVQELSICMALAPTQEMEILQPFVEKLHLMRLESSWNLSPTTHIPPAIA